LPGHNHSVIVQVVYCEVIYRRQGIDSGIPPINDSFMKREEGARGGRARRSSTVSV